MNDHGSDLDRAKTLFFQGLGHMDGGDLKAAEESFRATLAIVPQHGPSLNNLVVILTGQGRVEEVVRVAQAAIAADEDQRDAHVFLAGYYRDRRQWHQSLSHLERLVARDQSDVEAFANQSLVLGHLGRHEDAIASADRALALDPGFAAAQLNRAAALHQLKRYAEALAAYEAALKSEGAPEKAWLGRASVLIGMKRFDEALADCDRVLDRDSESVSALVARANIFALLKRYEDAIAIYDRVEKTDPETVDLWLNRGNLFLELKRYDDSLAAYDRALALGPDLTVAWVGRGNALYDLGRNAEAFDAYCRATDIDPNLAEGWFGRGNVCLELTRYDEAILAYDRALERRPDLDFARGYLFEVRNRICDWQDYDTTIADIAARAMRGEKVLGPFAAFNFFDSPALHLKVAKLFAETKYPPNRALPDIGKYTGRDRIRIGYFSADFRNHAVAFLIAELIEKHDRSKFEIIGFSFGPGDMDALRERLSKSFDRFVDVRQLSDEAAALLARRHEIDIAIDLTGFTTHERTGIFAARAAPVQASYLGYPGTMAADYFDYLIADPIVISEPQRVFYTEKIARLPHAYQVNDTKRQISGESVSRAQHDLPEKAFVFCSFNNNYKITPQMFDDWMAILTRVEGSVLWLLEDNAEAAQNLLREAKSRGMEQSRIIFARRTSLPRHLARHRLADLFLDTLPYNAHTTASDALWTGLPVLTRQGEAFAGRVAASLLHAIGLPELITTTREAYVELAVKLATQPDQLARIRDKLAVNRLTTPLFDIDRFTADIETLYAKMHDRHQRDLPPADIRV